MHYRHFGSNPGPNPPLRLTPPGNRAYPNLDATTTARSSSKTLGYPYTEVPDVDAEARILLSQPVAVQQAIQLLRALVREVLPEAAERAHPGWGIFNYYLNGELGYVGGAPARASRREGKDGSSSESDAAVLGFTRGVDLDDPRGLLTATSTARYMRQLRLPVGQPLPRDAIRDLLLQAARLNLERGPPEQEWRSPRARRR